MASAKAVTELALRPRDLTPNQTVAFTLEPDEAARAGVAEVLGILGVKKLRLMGKLLPQGAADWRLDATLGATVVQPCVVSLAPVTTRIDEAVTRLYLAAPPPAPEGEEAEMPEDDTVEALPEVIDLHVVALEALALALPAYPRASDAAAGEQTFGPPGAAPLTEEAAKPFAGLSALRDKLAKDD